MAESVPYEYLDTTGVIVADTSGLLTDVQSEYQDVFGADLIVTPDTPQGVLITAETLARTQVVNNNAALANQINPTIAGGTFLDAIMALTGVQRTAATQTVVPNVTLTGVAGTIVPAGSQAQTSAGDLFYSLATVTLTGGTATVNFASVAYGAIPCAANALTGVVTSVLGWETVNNTTAGTLGLSTQSDQEARAYRNNTLGFQGVALPVAITSALYAVPGVTSLFFQENVAAGTETINGISMVGHSIYVCVEGGSTTAIAAALLENKSSGCAWNGGTSVSVIEPASGQTYTVMFDIPTPIGILVNVYTTNGNEANITQAVLDFFAGNINGITGLGVGDDVSTFEIAGGIIAEYPTYQLTNVEIALESVGTFATTPIDIAVNQIAYIQASFITVIIA